MSDFPADGIKVLVVDDSAFMRRIVSDILSSEESITVAGTAKNGLEALQKVKILKPDVITLDVEMPVMDGLTCLKELLSSQYIPVVMVSKLTQEGAEDTIRALEYGAVDFITKPANIFDISDKVKMQEIVEKVKIAKNTTNNLDYKKQEIKNGIHFKTKSDIVKSNNLKHIVAIGSSTGGPKALQDVIPYIPGDVPAAFLIVQHMPAGFTKSLADRMDILSELTVKEAEDNEEVKPGFAYFAPGDFHMEVQSGSDKGLKIRITDAPPVSGLRPSINVLLNSLLNTGFNNVTCVIMTGMGRDGSEGITEIKRKTNGHIIAQDEKSCVVFGMPRAAIQTGVVDEVVSLNEISNVILKSFGWEDKASAKKIKSFSKKKKGFIFKKIKSFCKED